MGSSLRFIFFCFFNRFSLFSFFLLLRTERRQLGIRAVYALNSPAPLSALMSLLLFALLNAIRAYSVFPAPSPFTACQSLLHTRRYAHAANSNEYKRSTQSSHGPLNGQFDSFREKHRVNREHTFFAYMCDLHAYAGLSNQPRIRRNI